MDIIKFSEDVFQTVHPNGQRILITWVTQPHNYFSNVLETNLL